MNNENTHSSSLPHSDRDVPVYEQEATPPQPVEATLGSVTLKAIMSEEGIDPKVIQSFAGENINSIFFEAEQNAGFIPFIASEILHRTDSSVDARYPTADEIKREKVEARFISRPLRAISEKWSGQLDQFLENKAKKKVAIVGDEVVRVLDVLGETKSPRQELVNEVQAMYLLSEDRDPRWIMSRILYGIADPVHEFQDKFPLVSTIATTQKLKGMFDRREDVIEIFAPDLVRGLEGFLAKHGVQIETSRGYVESPMRWLADVVAPDKVDGIAGMVEKVLTDLHSVLPEDGERFKANIHALCREIVDRAENGEDGRALGRSLIDQLKPLISGD